MKFPLTSLLVLAVLGHANANTYTVINTNDSGAGSLRQAILDANSHSNSLNPMSASDMISFAIPGGGVKTIAPRTALPAITESAIVDGYTQPGASANTLVNGSNAVLFIELSGAAVAPSGVTGLTLSSGSSTVRGLVINRFPGFGIAITVGSNNNIIQGNFIGTNAAGTDGLGNLNNGIDITASPGNLIGGTAPGAGNLISANDGNGIYIHSGSDSTTVQGNRIGTNAAGNAIILGAGQTQISNSGDGIILESFANLVGGTTVGARNIVAASSGDAIDLQSASNNQVKGNSIGTDATGIINLGNRGGAGVRVSDGSGNTIGGVTSAEANLIANNLLGVQVDAFSGPASGNTIEGNSIFNSSPGLGIDLIGNGVTPNDTGDGDSGPNTLQNYPLITAASSSNGQLHINATLNSLPNQSYRIDFYGNFVASPSAFGEGRYFLGKADIVTDAAGNIAFSSMLTSFAPVNFVTATATDGAGNTSEFSRAVAVTGAPGRSLNLSARSHVLTGDNIAFGGLIIAGNAPKRLIIRGLGPSLPSYVPNRLADPVLKIFDSSSSTAIATNNDWKNNQQAEIIATGLAPSNDAEAAIVITLAPGAYTVQLSGNGNTTGIGLLDIYDLTPDSDSELLNVSARAVTETGDNILIGGVTIGGGGNTAFVVDAKGPSLPVASALADPTLSLYDGSGNLVTTNDDWQDDINQGQIPMGIRPTDMRESALYRVLGPGAYTAIVRGKNNTSGISLIEIWDVD